VAVAVTLRVDQVDMVAAVVVLRVRLLPEAVVLVVLKALLALVVMVVVVLALQVLVVMVAAVILDQHIQQAVLGLERAVLVRSTVVMPVLGVAARVILAAVKVAVTLVVLVVAAVLATLTAQLLHPEHYTAAMRLRVQ
jgi:hypothetical protein